jgi:hypothetical protein
MPRNVEFSPVMSTDDVREYFMQNLPPEVPRDVFEQGWSCYGDARLTVMKLGGPEKARIYWYFELKDPNDPEGDFIDAHAYIVPVDAKDEDLAYGNEFGFNRTAGFLRQKGEDITEDVFARPWTKL